MTLLAHNPWDRIKSCSNFKKGTMANLNERNIHLRPIASSNMHPIHLGAPEVKIPISSGFLFLGPLIAFWKLSCTHFKVGCYWKEVWQVPNTGDCVDIWRCFSSWFPKVARCFFDVPNGLSLWRLPRCPHWVSRTGWRGVTIRRRYFRQFQWFWLWGSWFLSISASRCFSGEWSVK